MYGLIDCNNFFASCERVFNPSLNGRPVVVLSNNDGCVIARSNETKALGIKMGTPAFQLKELIDKYDIAVFSSNYELYGDMSSRVMSIISENSPDIEIYSIDEAFINFSEIKDLQELGNKIIYKVFHGTGIPVSLGIAPTKTLAKVASKFAKKYPAYNKVCIIDSEDKRIKALKLFDIKDVWGVGRRISKRLQANGIHTAYDFTQQSQSWVRKFFTITGERTWKELNGMPCIDIESAPPTKKQICTSRSFGKMIEDYDNLAEAVSTHASSCARKLREQKSFAVSLMVFIHTNGFRDDLPQYWKNNIVKLPVPTADTTEIVQYALIALKQIYLKGYQYKKAGVIITEITEGAQQGLFDTIDREKQARLMKYVDKINGKYGSNVKLAIQGSGKEWRLKRELLSKHYTTDLKEILKIVCK